MNNTPKLDRRAAAEYCTSNGFKVSATTLGKLATIGGGPVFYKFGSRVVYDTGDLDAWVKSRLSRPLRSTSEEAA